MVFSDVWLQLGLLIVYVKVKCCHQRSFKINSEHNVLLRLQVDQSVVVSARGISMAVSFQTECKVTQRQLMMIPIMLIKLTGILNNARRQNQMHPILLIIKYAY